jgi:hypothetical protein
MNLPKILYRYDAYGDHINPYIFLTRYHVLSHTPKGCWIEIAWKKKKFILLGARKRYACPTIKEAQTSFFHRKYRQLRILKAQVEAVQATITHAEKMRDEGKPIDTNYPLKINEIGLFNNE